MKVQKTERTNTSSPKEKPNNSLQADQPLTRHIFPRYLLCFQHYF